MPDVLGSPPSPRAALFWNGTAWQWALVDAQGHLQLDVLSTAMDPLAATEATLATLATEATLAAFAAGAGTAANQATMITALQLIDNLVVALGGPGNARLIVRGEDQLFSFKGVLAESVITALSGDDGYVQVNAVPGGEIWVVTTVRGMNADRPTTAYTFNLFHDGAGRNFDGELRAIAQSESVYWGGHVYADVGDRIRYYSIGGLAADTCYVQVCGFRMTVET